MWISAISSHASKHRDSETAPFSSTEVEGKDWSTIEQELKSIVGVAQDNEAAAANRARQNLVRDERRIMRREAVTDSTA